MDSTRLAIIVGMGLVSYLIRVIPQLFLLGRSFPATFDLYLRYLAYALIASIISTSLFMRGPEFEAAAAPHRGMALVAAVVVSFWSRRPLLGMLIGTLLVLVLPRL